MELSRKGSSISAFILIKGNIILNCQNFSSLSKLLN